MPFKNWSNLSFGAFIEPVKEVKKKIFNIKTWHFWKSYRCFVCSVVGYVARTTIYKYIFVLHQYPCHNEILFPYTHCHFVQPNSNTVFSIYLLFSQNGFDVVKKCLSGTLFPSPISKFFYAWFVIWLISTKWKESTIHLLGEFRSRDKISFHSDYKAICETFTLCIYFKGTLMPIWKSANIFVFIWT